MMMEISPDSWTTKQLGTQLPAAVLICERARAQRTKIECLQLVLGRLGWQGWADCEIQLAGRMSQMPTAENPGTPESITKRPQGQESYQPERAGIGSVLAMILQIIRPRSMPSGESTLR